MPIPAAAGSLHGEVRWAGKQKYQWDTSVATPRWLRLAPQTFRYRFLVTANAADAAADLVTHIPVGDPWPTTGIEPGDFAIIDNSGSATINGNANTPYQAGEGWFYRARGWVKLAGTGASVSLTDLSASLVAPFVIAPDVDAVIPFGTEVRDGLNEFTAGELIASASGNRNLELGLDANTAGMRDLKLQRSLDNGATWSNFRVIRAGPNNSFYQESMSGIFLNTADRLRLVVSRSQTHITDAIPVIIGADSASTYLTIQGN